MTQTEVTSEVFRIIRANDYYTAKNLWHLIKDHLSDVPVEMLQKAIEYIYDKTE